MFQAVGWHYFCSKSENPELRLYDETRTSPKLAHHHHVIYFPNWVTFPNYQCLIKTVVRYINSYYKFIMVEAVEWLSDQMANQLFFFFLPIRRNVCI